MTAIHPALILLGTAAVVSVARGRLRQIVLIFGAVASLVAVSALVPEADWAYPVSGVSLQLLRVDPLSRLFGLIVSLITVIGVVYSLHVRRSTEHVAILLYAAGSLGVVFAGDWLTAFVFWEVMGVASLVVIWHGNFPGTAGAGFRYLFVHISGGALFFAGILLHVTDGGGLAIEPLNAATTTGLGYWLILAGVAVNAAIPPFHAWLTDAYPEASVTGAVFLSAYTTKTAVYVLLRAFPGTELLVWAGVFMALYGVVYAVLENDIRRLLGYHIVSQVGYMVAGVGMGTMLATDGSAAHAFCHILYKALLLMGVGAVIHATGRRTLTDLGGIWRQMPVVVGLYLVGAFSISGVPLFNGFISKAMIVTAAADDGRVAVELLLTLASIGTFLHTGLKLPYFTFFGPRCRLDIQPIPRNMIVAMALGATCCIALGLAPGWLYAQLPSQGVGYYPYRVDHVVASLQLLLGTGLGFWFLLAKLGGQSTVSLDIDWLYRRPLSVVFDRSVGGAAVCGRTVQERTQAAVVRLRSLTANPLQALAFFAVLMPTESAGGVRRTPAARYDENRYRLPVGTTVFWVVVGFVALVLLVW